MLICHCSLAGTAACWSCPRWLEECQRYSYSPAPYPYVVWPSTGTETVPPQPEKKVRRITKTFEYDGLGRVTKEIVEEE